MAILEDLKRRAALTVTSPDCSLTVVGIRNRTKGVILEIYDVIADSMRTGQPYLTCLNPPPADPRMGHLLREGGRV